MTTEPSFRSIFAPSAAIQASVDWQSAPVE
jgi:hypothetical protein